MMADDVALARDYALKFGVRLRMELSKWTRLEFPNMKTKS